MVDFLIKNLSFTYPGAQTKALVNISLEIKRGEFIVLCGKSGSGKSTLLSMLKPELSPHGKAEGETVFFGKSRSSYSLRESASDIGYLMQNTDYQPVTHSVRTELAFGLENLGFDSRTVRLRTAEISAYFSLDKILDKRISELSGGQKQLVCLAGILAMHPKVIIFDEPASQLDPIAAQNIFTAAKRLCRENGMTVIITEHRLESLIPEADRLIVLDKGRIIADCPPAELNRELFSDNGFISRSLPVPTRIASALGAEKPLPLDTGSGRIMLERLLRNKTEYTKINRTPKILSGKNAVEAKNVYFAYDKSGYVLKDFSISIPEGSFFALLGANAAGKSTAVSVLSGLLPLKSGKVKICGKDIRKYSEKELYNGIIAVLPQRCEALFSGNTVKEDLMKVLEDTPLSKKEKEEKIQSVALITEISGLLDRHPYDISGGEMQRAALAIILLKEPAIIFTDEPTKGMDTLFKDKFADIIKRLCDKGTTVITVSHDTEFCALHCDRCALISDGMTVTEADKYEFFANNYFYTTSANKMARDIFPDAVTEEEVIELCLKNLQN